jgi:hypothetical protein
MILTDRRCGDYHCRDWPATGGTDDQRNSVPKVADLFAADPYSRHRLNADIQMDI